LHLKADYRERQNFLQRTIGDAIASILVAAGFDNC
jgi:hypothetical protein